MANLILSSTEAQTLYNTGRLIRTVDCDWQPPRQAIEIRDDTVYVMLSTGPVWSKKLTPPLEVGAVYDVKEPCMSDFGRGNARRVWFDSDSGEFDLTAEEMPDWASRMKATPTYKLIIKERKLRWYEELKRV